MATFTFDGTSSITATKTDTVLITADPTSFTQATDNGSNVALTFGANTLTITGTTLAAGNLPNVFVQGGTFQYADSTNTNGAGTGNTLAFFDAAAVTTGTTTATSKVAVFGGLGRTDVLDGNDTINIGGKGSFLVFGNSGDDSVTQTVAAFDSTSIVNVNGNTGNDSVDFTTATNSKASIFVGAGAGTDSIAIINSGTTTIFGGVDSSDGADTITFNGEATGAAGVSTIFGNGGGDSITIGGVNPLDATSTTTVYGGAGADSVAVTAGANLKAVISVLGNEGADSITVTGFGNTFITGGNQSGDQSNDGADTISFTGSGTTLIYGNLGDDSITATLNGTDTTNISIYGGKGVDTITQTATGGKDTVFIAGGEGGDSIDAQGNGGAVTIYGGISSSDATDGADTISYGSNGTSTGAANIFANGGDDTVSIGVLGTDTTSTVTVYGGGGKDSIFVAAQTATSQDLVINGNDGSDTFTIATGKGQSVTVADFAVGTTGDKLAITGLGATTIAVAGGTYGTLQNALDAASKAAVDGATKAGAVVFGGSTYVVLEQDASSTFTAAADQSIKLTGVTDLGSVVSNTTVV